MRNFKYIVSKVVLLIYLLCGNQSSFTQVSENFRIINPYQTFSTTSGRTMGGATIALPDSVPFIIYNPANLVQIKRPKIFLSLNAGQGYLKNISQPGIGLKPHEWKDDLTIKTFALSFPFRLLKRSFTLASSYTRTNPYDYQTGEDNFISYSEYSGYFQTLSIGLGTEFFSNLRVGVGWSHYFGKGELKILNFPSGRCTHNTSEYNGNLFYMGIQKDIYPKIVFGFTIYIPFQLIITNKNIYNGGQEYKTKQHQKFSGAFRAGLSYKINKYLKFGLGFEYQNKFTTELRTPYDTTQVRYSDISTLTGGFEYDFSIKKVALPIYIMYKVTWLPDQKWIDSFRIMPPHLHYDNNCLSHILEFGGNITLRYFTIFLAAQYNQTGKYLKYPSPLISAWFPPSRFDVRKFAFSFGLLTNF